MANKKLIDPLEPMDLIDPLEPEIKDEPVKSFEQKRYIILWINNEESSEFGNHYMVCTGRTEAYDYIKSIIDDIDIHESFILTETLQTETKSGRKKYYITPLDESISVLHFMRKIQDNYNDGFDINDYDYSYEGINPDEINNKALKRNPDFDIANKAFMDRMNDSNYDSHNINSSDDNDENDV